MYLYTEQTNKVPEKCDSQWVTNKKKYVWAFFLVCLFEEFFKIYKESPWRLGLFSDWYFYEKQVSFFSWMHCIQRVKHSKFNGYLIGLFIHWLVHSFITSFISYTVVLVVQALRSPFCAYALPVHNCIVFNGLNSLLMLRPKVQRVFDRSVIHSFSSLSFIDSCSRLVINGSWVRIPLGVYALRQGILSTIIVSLDPGVVNGYPARIYSF